MSKSKNADMPAMPNLEGFDVDGNVYQHNEYTGMTKREMFAMAAMQGLLVNMGRNEFNDVISVSREAVNAADALLAELESTK